MKWFAVSCMYHDKSTSITYHVPMLQLAHSKEEAEGIMLNILKSEYPVIKGYKGHSTNALEIPSNLYQKG